MPSNPRKRMRISVSTVSPNQGEDRNCCVLSPFSNRVEIVTSISMFRDPRPLYVEITCEKVLLYNFGDADFLS